VFDHTYDIDNTDLSSSSQLIETLRYDLHNYLSHDLTQQPRKVNDDEKSNCFIPYTTEKKQLDSQQTLLSDELSDIMPVRTEQRFLPHYEGENHNHYSANRPNKHRCPTCNSDVDNALQTQEIANFDTAASRKMSWQELFASLMGM